MPANPYYPLVFIICLTKHADFNKQEANSSTLLLEGFNTSKFANDQEKSLPLGSN